MPLYASNFAANSLSGTVKVSAGTANIRISVNPLAFEGNKQFVLKLRKDSVTGTVIATTPNISIADTTTFVSLTANTATVAEGNLVAFSLVTTNVINGAIVYYSVFPATANVTSDDFVANTGSAIITNNAALFTLQANTNFAPVDETGETFRVQLRTNDAVTGNIVYTTSNITILDTDKTYNIITFAPPSFNVTESSSIVFTFAGTNIPLGTTFYYETTGNATVTSNIGSFVLNSLSNTFTVSAGAVPANESRAFTVNLRTGSAAGPIVRTSDTVYVVDSALAYTTATGGNQVFIDNGYKVHIFLSSNNFSISRAGVGNFANINYLAIGGGGGAAGMYQSGGAGAGGALLSNVLFNSTGTYTITVGSGAAGGAVNTFGSNGGNTTISGPGLSTIIAYGGGGTTDDTPVASYPGGSGGGAPLAAPAGYGTGTPGQGYPGGSAVAGGAPAYNGRAGGGGGAGGAGQPGATQSNQGGIGITSSITGTSTGYAGGGGGGAYGIYGYPGGDAYTGYGGGGGGGYAPSTRVNAESGSVNTGGGGGGTERSGTGVGGSGGSGIVILRYPFVEAAQYTSLTSNAYVIEGANAIFTLNTLNLTSNTLLYYTTVGNVISSDFVSGNTGSFRSTANSTTITLRTNSNIPASEERFFQLQIRADSLTDPVAITSNVFTIKDTIYSFGPVVELLIVAGGGPGSAGGGGGGAGGLIYYGAEVPKTPNGSAYQTLNSTAYTITVGAGGSGTPGSGLGPNGSPSLIAAAPGTIYEATGGGAGAYANSSPQKAASAGGSGGGQGYPAPGGQVFGAGGAGTPGQGNPGGGNYTYYWFQAGGGGGGAGGAGQTAQPSPATPSSPGTYTMYGGYGGSGLQYSISGTATYYAGGGGGFVDASASPTRIAGAAGLGGGGAGTASPYGGSGNPGTVNTGGGGGGNGNPPVAGPQGGSGVVILRYPSASYANAVSAPGATLTIAGGYRVYRFTTSGDITF